MYTFILFKLFVGSSESLILDWKFYQLNCSSFCSEVSNKKTNNLTINKIKPLKNYMENPTNFDKNVNFQ